LVKFTKPVPRVPVSVVNNADPGKQAEEAVRVAVHPIGQEKQPEKFDKVAIMGQTMVIFLVIVILPVDEKVNNVEVVVGKKADKKLFPLFDAKRNCIPLKRPGRMI